MKTIIHLLFSVLVISSISSCNQETAEVEEIEEPTEEVVVADPEISEEELREGIDRVVEGILLSLKQGKLEDYLKYFGNERDRRFLVENMELANVPDEKAEEIKRNLLSQINDKLSESRKEGEEVFEESIWVLQKASKDLAKADIIWDVPKISEQMGMVIADIPTYIQLGDSYFLFNINLVQAKDNWLINFPQPVQSYDKALNRKFAGMNFYKKLEIEEME